MVTANQKFRKILRLKKESKQKNIVIRSQEKKTKEEGKKKRFTKIIAKQLPKWQ